MQSIGLGYELVHAECGLSDTPDTVRRAAEPCVIGRSRCLGSMN